MKIVKSCLLSALATLGIVYLYDTSLSAPVIACILLFALLGFLFHSYPYVWENRSKESRNVALLFSAMLLCAGDKLDLLFAGSILSIFVFLAAYIGLYITLSVLVDLLYRTFINLKIHDAAAAGRSEKIGKLYLCSFLSMWIVYLIYFLNQYPGSMSCDSPVQLMQAMGDIDFENANPFIHTILLTFWVQLGIKLFHTAAAGMAVYSVFQLTLTALVFAYTVTIIYKNGFHKLLVIFAHCFFNFMPYNIVYASTMWKDTFFALLFLATLTFAFDTFYHLDPSKKPKKSTLLIFFFLVLLTSLARNSGWSSLLVWGIFLLIYAFRSHQKVYRIFSIITLAGVLLSLFIVSFLYPLCGISYQGGITVGISVPIQQVARVVAMDGNITEDGLEVVNDAIPLETILELYDETISDSMKWYLNTQVVKDYAMKYLRLWLSLGKNNPKIYLDAYLRLMENYWSLRSDDWLWDTRHRDNIYDINRTPLIFPDTDLTEILEIPYNLPEGNLLSAHSVFLWLSILFFGFSSVKHNKLGKLMYWPIFMIYIGLIITSPVSLFRYTYCAAVCVPLLFCFPYLKDQSSIKQP